MFLVGSLRVVSVQWNSFKSAKVIKRVKKENNKKQTLKQKQKPVGSDGKKIIFAHVVREFKSKVAIVRRAIFSFNNATLTIPEGK